MARISIVLPVYNVERYLAACLESLRGQSYSDIEIVCVDDGSTDRSPVLLRMAAEVDSRVRIITKPNGGLSSARNAGLRAATGDFVWFLDSDDFVHPKACQFILKAIDKTGAEFATFGAYVHPGNLASRWHKRVLGPGRAVYDGFHPDLLFKESSRPFVWRSVFSREFLIREGLEFDESVLFGEDQVFYFAAYPLARRTVLMWDRLYYYRVSRPESLMASRFANRKTMMAEHQAIARVILNDWRQRGWLEEYRAPMLDWVFDFLATEAIGGRDKVARTMRASLTGLLTDYFPPGAWMADLTPPARALLTRLRSTGGALASLGDNATLVAWQASLHPLRTAVGLGSRVTNSWPALKLRGVLWRLTPVSSRTHWKRVEELNGRLEDDAQRAHALDLLHAEWAASRQPARDIDEHRVGQA